MSAEITLSSQGQRSYMGVRVVPDNGMSVFKMDMTDINYAINERINDIQHVNPHKAPELLTIFNQAYLGLGEYITNLEYQLNRAKNELDKIRARLLMDEIPQILEAKKLSNSKDIRDALIVANSEYQIGKDLVDQLDAVVANLQVKQDSVEMAYNSVKKILGTDSYDMSKRATARQLDGLIDETRAQPGQSQQGIFGTPNYETRR